MRGKRFFWIPAVLVLGACSPNLSNIGKESDPTRFYTLAAMVKETPPDLPRRTNLTVGIGAVDVAEYLDRSHIVIRESNTRLNLSDFDRWAATPEQEIQRVLAANLSTLLGTEQVLRYPWKVGLELGVTVEMTVERFELGEDGQVHLVAAWQLFANGDRTPVLFRRSELSKPSSAHYEVISQALSELTGELSTIIAAAIRQNI